MKDLGLPKVKHLKHRKDIQVLFELGKYVYKYPIALIYTRKEPVYQESQSPLFQVGFTVSKRLYKRAVDRNHVKRLLREGFRVNQELVPKDKEGCLHMMFIYKGKEIIEYKEIESVCAKLLKLLP